MPLPELTATGRENGAGGPSATEDPSPAKKLKAEPALASSPSAAPTVPDVSTKTSSSTGDDATHEDTNEDDDEEVTYWKRQFYDLRNKRETEAETQYKVLKDRTQQREKSLKAYIRDIEEQLVAAKGTIKASVASLAAAEAAAAEAEAASAAAAAEAAAKAESEVSEGSNDKTDNNSGFKDQLAEASTTIRVQKQILSHYKMLTGIKVTNVTSQSLDVTVRNVKRGAAAKFRLTSVQSTAANSSGEEISLRLDPLEGTEHLPEYMRAAIEFEVDQCPTLMREVLDTMFPDEE